MLIQISFFAGNIFGNIFKRGAILKEFLNFDDFLNKFKRHSLKTILDKITFARILFFWISITISFGLIFFFFKSDKSYLYYVLKSANVNSIFDSIYFSFVAATTTGFGDIIPIGAFKVIAVLEVISGLLLLALVTSRLVSIKQDILLNELYDLSFKEKVNKIRSSLLLFRQNVDRILIKIEDNSIRKREVLSLYVYFSSLEDVLNEVFPFVSSSGNKYFTKHIDSVNLELIIISILNSFEKTNELLTALINSKLEWKSDLNKDMVNRCLSSNEKIFSSLAFEENLMKPAIRDLNLRKHLIVSAIKEKLEHRSP